MFMPLMCMVLTQYYCYNILGSNNKATHLNDALTLNINTFTIHTALLSVPFVSCFSEGPHALRILCVGAPWSVLPGLHHAGNQHHEAHLSSHRCQVSHTTLPLHHLQPSPSSCPTCLTSLVIFLAYRVFRISTGASICFETPLPCPAISFVLGSHHCEDRYRES